MNLQDLKKQMPIIFKQVKNDVRKVYRRHRAGLSLGLVEMGMYRGSFIGGMHFSPGTDILINKTPLKVILKECTYEIVWAYIYHILLHEYIHSLGVLDEQQCRNITLRISEKIFNESKHPAIILAKNGIGSYFPNLHLVYAPPELRHDGKIEYIYNFDQESYDYIS